MLSLSAELGKAKPLDEVDSYLNLLPPVDPDYLAKAKNLGFRNLIFNLEVFGDKDFRKVCRGKHAVVPYRTYLERMVEAVRFFGRGRVFCGFVLGAQPIQLLKDGVTWLAEQGITPDYTVFTPKKGTPWEKRIQPSIEEIADFSAFVGKILKKHRYQPLYCNLSSRSSILSEL